MTASVTFWSLGHAFGTACRQGSPGPLKDHHFMDWFWPAQQHGLLAAGAVGVCMPGSGSDKPAMRVEWQVVCTQCRRWGGAYCQHMQPCT